jgi:taurine dioxygenase
MQLRELSDAFGTEVTDLDVDAALADTALQGQLQQLFDTRGVLVFRDLDIDLVTQANLVRMLIGMGPLAEGESATGREGDKEFYVSNKEAGGGAPHGRLLFHSDMAWSEHTFQVLSLYGSVVEQPATPTTFVSTANGWATLPDELRAMVEGRSAVQGHEEGGRADDPNVLVSHFENLPTRTTPIGMTHPRTGATLLYVSEQMTQSIEGLGKDDGEALLQELFAHLYRPEAVYAHVWQEHDLVAWDNINMQHGRPNVTLEGPARKVFAPIPPRGANPKAPTFAAAK